MDARTKSRWLVAIFFMIAAVATMTFVATPARAQAVTTDLADYQPGMTVNISGGGWFPGDTVSISIHEEPQPGDPDFLTSAIADAGGSIVNSAFAVNIGDIGRTFTVTAVGESSGATATTTFTDTPATCGDGTKAPSEQCDDGNTNNNDGCSSTCNIESCGDGIVQTGEQCDEGNQNGNQNSTCSATCTTVAAACTPGSVTQAIETKQTEGSESVDFDEICEEGKTDEWHFVITSVEAEANCPASLSLTFDDGSTTVNLEKFTGGICHYTLFTHLTSTLLSATTTIYANWADGAACGNGQFNVSHTPCGEPPPAEVGSIQVCKYDDKDASGTDNTGDADLSGWLITVYDTDNSLVGQDTTKDDGCVTFPGLLVSKSPYTVTEAAPTDADPPWFNTDPGPLCLMSATVTSSVGIANCSTDPSISAITVVANETTTVDFGNIQSAEKVGQKFYDINTNGVNEVGGSVVGEVGVVGFKITLSGTDLLGTSVSATDFTDANGVYEFTGLLPSQTGGDNYTVTEVKPNNTWINTTPTSKNFTLTEGEIEEDNDFGNVCVGAGGGLTLGYWSNPNGYATMRDGGSEASELQLLSDLNLVTASGTAYNPVCYCAASGAQSCLSGQTANTPASCGTSTSFRRWILSATATNMANMLSAQLAAMKLNVEALKVSGGSLVYAGTAPVGCSVTGLNGAGFISVNDLMTAANSSLGTNPNTTAISAARSCQEFMKNALDAGNNNLNFVQAQACPFTTPY